MCLCRVWCLRGQSGGLATRDVSQWCKHTHWCIYGEWVPVFLIAGSLLLNPGCARHKRFGRVSGLRMDCDLSQFNGLHLIWKHWQAWLPKNTRKYVFLGCVIEAAHWSIFPQSLFFSFFELFVSRNSFTEWKTSIQKLQHVARDTLDLL